ncbi:PAS domain-containing sensor histidine kinase [Hymenobacter sp. BT635]|uniref:histidine kinase n=1 Tax=Hymenobacter nitidus TaxID=2880929 RepID=A0ABS8AGK9_9BACT|nr:PAS domain-containing sensor histidine kinase [Hymenobacter nitidus]MCB2379087.1 PAS domain-containing sensor histidine kinase [Hymenobacter nitidus]
MMNSAASVGSMPFELSRTTAAFVLNERGELLHATAGLAEWLGEPPGQFTEARLLELLRPADPAHTPPPLEYAASGGVVGYKVQVVLRGEVLLLWVTLLPLPGVAGPRAGVYGLVKPASSDAATNTALLERERYLSIIFNNIADVTFVLNVEAAGRYRFGFVNQAFEKTTGLSVEKVVGSYVHDIIPEPSLSLVLEKYHEAITTGQRVVWLETSHYPSGRVVGEVSVTPVVDDTGTCHRLVGIVHDQTQQKEAEEELVASNERFHFALKATTDALYDWSVVADTLLWGEGFETLFGYQLPHNPTPFDYWGDKVHPEDYQRVVAGLRKIALATDTFFWQKEYRFARADGSWAVVFDRGYLLRDEQGQPVRMIGAMQDITERREAEELQQQMARKLLTQYTDLQQFTYIVSHNLRAPLANALGFANLLTRVDKQSTVFDDSLKNLQTSLQKLDGVLTDVNGILSVRDRQHGYRPEPVALAAVCRQALHGLEELLRECGGQLHIDIPPELRILGSRAYFHSIFHNLISNAIKYRSDARPLQINISATTSPAQDTTIVVADNGLGFDQEQAGDNLFQLYRRFHPDKPGRGIGLFLVKAHVESMHGQVTVESRVNEGTQFILYFSLYAADENLPD